MIKSLVRAGPNIVTVLFVAQFICLPAGAEVSKEMSSKVALMESQVDFGDCKLLYLNEHENYGKD